MAGEIVNGLLAKILPWIFLFGLLSILGTVFKLFLLPKIKGWFGEACINFWIRRRLDQEVYHLIPDVMLPTPDGTTQIDHVIVSRYGIFVLETKNYKGWIFGSEKGAQWTQQIYRRKERFQNPLRQNYKHIKTMSDLTGIAVDYFKSVIVFVGESKFKTDMPDNVVHVRDFIRHIKSHATVMIQDAQVPEIVATIQEWAGTLTEDQKKSHVKNLRRNKAAVSSDSAAPACPRCGQDRLTGYAAPCLLCAERMGENCHRNLLAQYLAETIEGAHVTPIPVRHKDRLEAALEGYVSGLP